MYAVTKIYVACSNLHTVIPLFIVIKFCYVHHYDQELLLLVNLPLMIVQTINKERRRAIL